MKNLYTGKCDICGHIRDDLYPPIFLPHCENGNISIHKYQGCEGCLEDVAYELRKQIPSYEENK
jgi:hypothetical protein